MTMPGFITGLPLNGQALGNAIVELLPALPFEFGFGTPPVPRGLARQFMRGVGIPAARPAAPAVVPPVTFVPTPLPQPPIQPAAPVVQGNVIKGGAQQPVYRGSASGGGIIQARAVRVKPRERPGMM